VSPTTATLGMPPPLEAPPQQQRPIRASDRHVTSRPHCSDISVHEVTCQQTPFLVGVQECETLEMQAFGRGFGAGRPVEVPRPDPHKNEGLTTLGMWRCSTKAANGESDTFDSVSQSFSSETIVQSDVVALSTDHDVLFQEHTNMSSITDVFSVLPRLSRDEGSVEFGDLDNTETRAELDSESGYASVVGSKCSKVYSHGFTARESHVHVASPDCTFKERPPPILEHSLRQYQNVCAGRSCSSSITCTDSLPTPAQLDIRPPSSVGHLSNLSPALPLEPAIDFCAGQNMHSSSSSEHNMVLGDLHDIGAQTEPGSESGQPPGWCRKHDEVNVNSSSSAARASHIDLECASNLDCGSPWEQAANSWSSKSSCCGEGGGIPTELESLFSDVNSRTKKCPSPHVQLQSTGHGLVSRIFRPTADAEAEELNKLFRLALEHGIRHLQRLKMLAEAGEMRSSHVRTPCSQCTV